MAGENGDSAGQSLIGSAVDDADVGGETAKRFRYQASFAASLALQMFSDEECPLECVYCELLDDVLAKKINGKYIPYQVKTRKLGYGPFKSDDRAFISALNRFCHLHKQFGDAIEKFIFVSNCGCCDGKADKDSPHVLRQTITDRGPAHVKSSRTAICMRIRDLAASLDEDLETVASVIAKVEAETWTGLEDADLRVQHALSTLPEFQNRPLMEAMSAAKDLVNEAFSAGSLRYQAGVLDHLSIHEDAHARRNREIAESKRLDRERIQKVFNKHLGGSDLLTGRSCLELGEIPQNEGRMRAKMAAGGLLAASVENIEDLRTSMESLLARWAYQAPEKNSERWEHIQVLVNAACQEARDMHHDPTKAYGREMLVELRHRLQVLAQDRARVFNLSEQHLLGVAGILTEACKVWWSEQFDLQRNMA